MKCQILFSKGDNFHKMSDPVFKRSNFHEMSGPVCWEKEEKYFNKFSAKKIFLACYTKR